MELVPCSRRRNRDCDVHEFDLNLKPKQKGQLGLAATTIDDLEDSLLTEILLRLPLVWAKRCQAVSKRWYAIISDPYFICRIDQQQRLNKRNFIFLFHNDFDCKNRVRVLLTTNEPYFKSESFSLKFLPFSGRGRRQSLWIKEPAVLVASCNDLLLWSTCRWKQDVYYICNPLALDWVKLPPPPPPTEGCFNVGLMCDEHNYDYSTAAAATSACKYAVVRIPELDNSPVFTVQIFSSDTGEWRENVVSCAPRKFASSLFGRNGIPFKGLLFWLSPGNGLIGLDPYNDGQFRHFVDVPSEFLIRTSAFDNEGFGVCNGRLILFKISQDPVLGIFFIGVWDLQGYEKSEWIQKKRVYFHDMVSEYSSWLTEASKTPNFSPRVLGCEPDDSDVVYIITLHKRVLKVVLCNLRLGTLEEVYDAPTESLYLNEVITYKLSWRPTPINSPSVTRCLTEDIHSC